MPALISITRVRVTNLPVAELGTPDLVRVKFRAGHAGTETTARPVNLDGSVEWLKPLEIIVHDVNVRLVAVVQRTNYLGSWSLVPDGRFEGELVTALPHDWHHTSTIPSAPTFHAQLSVEVEEATQRDTRLPPFEGVDIPDGRFRGAPSPYYRDSTGSPSRDSTASCPGGELWVPSRPEAPLVSRTGDSLRGTSESSGSFGYHSVSSSEALADAPGVGGEPIDRSSSSGASSTGDGMFTAFAVPLAETVLPAEAPARRRGHSSLVEPRAPRVPVSMRRAFSAGYVPRQSSLHSRRGRRQSSFGGARVGESVVRVAAAEPELEPSSPVDRQLRSPVGRFARSRLFDPHFQLEEEVATEQKREEDGQDEDPRRELGLVETMLQPEPSPAGVRPLCSPVGSFVHSRLLDPHYEVEEVEKDDGEERDNSVVYGGPAFKRESIAHHGVRPTGGSWDSLVKERRDTEERIEEVKMERRASEDYEHDAARGASASSSISSPRRRRKWKFLLFTGSSSSRTATSSSAASGEALLSRRRLSSVQSTASAPPDEDEGETKEGEKPSVPERASGILATHGRRMGSRRRAKLATDGVASAAADLGTPPARPPGHIPPRGTPPSAPPPPRSPPPPYDEYMASLLSRQFNSPAGLAPTTSTASRPQLATSRSFTPSPPTSSVPSLSEEGATVGLAAAPRHDAAAATAATGSARSWPAKHAFEAIASEADTRIDVEIDDGGADSDLYDTGMALGGISEPAGNIFPPRLYQLLESEKGEGAVPGPVYSVMPQESLDSSGRVDDDIERQRRPMYPEVRARPRLEPSESEVTTASETNSEITSSALTTASETNSYIPSSALREVPPLGGLRSASNSVVNVSRRSFNRGVAAKDPVIFSCFAPPAVIPGTDFDLKVVACLRQARDDVLRRAMSEGVYEGGTPEGMSIGRGKRVTVELYLPEDAFKILPPLSSRGFRDPTYVQRVSTVDFKWTGETNAAKFRVECKANATPGFVQCEAKVIEGSSVVRLSFGIEVAKPGYIGGGSNAQRELDSVIEEVEGNVAVIPYEELEFVREIGKGNQAKTFHCRWKGKDVAVKSLAPSSMNRSGLEHEATILSLIGHHPNIVDFYGLSHEGDEGVHVVTKLEIGGSIEDALGLKRRGAVDGLGNYGSGHSLTNGFRGSCHGSEYDGSTRVAWARDIALGLATSHAAGVLHNDVASRNALLSKPGSGGRGVLCDFGISRILRGNGVEKAFLIDASHPDRWPVRQLPPESLRHPFALTRESDAWMYGIFLYELFEGRQPWAGLDNKEVMRLVSEGRDPPETPDMLKNQGDHLVKLYKSCLSTDSAKRPSLEHVVEQFSFSSNSFR